ncbi:MAG: prepilin-type N-terminal cleavage/methylation domain-containing protein [Candidatus Zambryskibacteria bacterium]|nr:prepilin-type N-terminal cleavage/methylation domain-containing protein [Candidatus Zambryskibacteria bacterium]
MKLSKDSQNGFTLIELLVVVAIIGILSSVVLASLNSARAKARDAKRASDVHQLKTALEFYYNDNGFYPSIVENNSGVDVAQLQIVGSLAPYLKQVPDDPLGASQAWQYVRGPAGNNSYGLWIYYEKTSARCGSGVNFNPGWWGIGSNMCPF